MPQDFKKENSQITPSFSGKIFLFQIILFSLSLVLGIFSAKRLKELFPFQKIPEPISIWQFLIWFFLATFFLLFLIYFFKSKKEKKFFFKILFLVVVTLGNLFFFSLWFGSIFSLFLTSLLVFLWLKKSSIFWHNLFLILAIAAIGARLGISLKPESVIFLLIFFSIYDYIAVYKTGHMIKMAKEMISQKSILGLVIPQNISDFQTSLKKIKPGGKFLILGAGDIVFPLIFCSSLMIESFFHSLIVGTFSLLGMLFSFWLFISQKIRAPIPALPPIALFSIIGYLITKLI